MSSTGLNVMNLLTQLRETQEKLRSAEARVKVLEEENKKLRAQATQPTTAPNLKRKLDVLEAEQDALQMEFSASSSFGGDQLHSDQQGRGSQSPRGLRHDELEAHDRVLRELKQQVVEMTRRSAALEREKTDTNALMRRQYETRIESLETELRRLRAVAGGQYKQQVQSGSFNPLAQYQQSGAGGSGGAPSGDYSPQGFTAGATTLGSADVYRPNTTLPSSGAHTPRGLSGTGGGQYFGGGSPYNARTAESRRQLL
jgi:hypothetical protein